MRGFLGEMREKPPAAQGARVRDWDKERTAKGSTNCRGWAGLVLSSYCVLQDRRTWACRLPVCRDWALHHTYPVLQAQVFLPDPAGWGRGERVRFAFSVQQQLEAGMLMPVLLRTLGSRRGG